MTARDSKGRLNSWKAIARYLDCSVRTAKRWEDEEGLPVHRHRHQVQASVYAFVNELEQWREQRSVTATRPAKSAPRAETGQPSLAVLPFGFLGSEPSREYLADGLTEEVIDSLSGLRDLRVISRTSAMVLKNEVLDAGAIARRLRVTHFLEGTLRQSRERIRVTARLVDAVGDAALWSEQYSGELDDVFEIQERIARQIVAALRLHLTLEEDDRLSRRYVTDPTAWQCLMQARREAMRWNRKAIDRAVELLTHGLRAAGENSELLAALGRAHLQYRESGLDFTDEPIRRAQSCADKARMLEPDSPAVLQLEAWLAYADGRIVDAVGKLETALAIEYNDPDTLALLVNCLTISGQPDRAMPFVDRLLAVDPLTPLNLCLPGWAAASAGEFARAAEHYRKAFEADPDNPLMRLFYLWILAMSGEFGQAVAIGSGFGPGLESHPASRLGALFIAALNGSDVPDADEMLWTTAENSEIFARLLAETYAFAGDETRAFKWLRAAMDRGFINHPYISRFHPHFSRFDGARQAALLGEMRSRWERFGQR